MQIIPSMKNTVSGITGAADVLRDARRSDAWAAGAIAAKLLESLNIRVKAYTKCNGPVEVAPDRFDLAECEKNKLYMPDAAAAAEAEQYLERKMAEKDSAGGIVECVIAGLPAGLGEPVFDKFNANLAKVICSIGAVKGFEIGEGFHAAQMAGSENNDALSWSRMEASARRRTMQAAF